ncbi:MAG: citrate lyase holo-[acyl-carrier protein] synthase [Caulobacteraceae bacterium]
MKISASSLEDILAARENREKRRISLIKEYDIPVISFTLNIPGAVKDKPLYRKVFEKGIEVVRLVLGEANIIYTETIYPITGPEAFMCVNMGARKIKVKAVGIEEDHPLGRLFDFDVFDCSFEKLSRTEMDLPERRCLICDAKAVLCARSRKHGLEELEKRIEKITDSYFIG